MGVIAVGRRIHRRRPIAAAHVRRVRTWRTTSAGPADRGPAGAGVVGIWQRCRRRKGHGRTGHRPLVVGSAAMSDVGALRVSDPERLRRWRMVLGGADDGADGSASGVTGVQLDGNDARVDAALAAVYDSKPRARGGGGRSGGLGSPPPSGGW